MNSKTLMFAAVIGLALSLAACGGPDAAVQDDKMTEPAAAEFEVFSWDQTKDAMSNGGVLVDARKAESYTAGHIEGAVNAASNDEAALQAALPEAKDTWVVFYCGGPQCKASNKAASMAAAWGYTNVAEYKGGYPEWSEMQASAAPAEADPVDGETAPEEAAPAE